MKLFERIVENLEKEIQKLNQERLNDGGFLLPKAKFTLLGQFSLLANPKIAAKLDIPATMDIDAKIDAEWVIKEAFKKIIEKENLVYDEDSHLIWIPEGSTYETLHESAILECKCLSPIYAILSKAIKAKEKNRVLVGEAIALFGDELVKLIIKHGGDPKYFVEDL